MKTEPIRFHPRFSVADIEYHQFHIGYPLDQKNWA
jgi:hypothetical protein